MALRQRKCAYCTWCVTDGKRMEKSFKLTWRFTLHETNWDAIMGKTTIKVSSKTGIQDAIAKLSQFCIASIYHIVDLFAWITGCETPSQENTAFYMILQGWGWDDSFANWNMKENWQDSQRNQFQEINSLILRWMKDNHLEICGGIFYSLIRLERIE